MGHSKAIAISALPKMWTTNGAEVQPVQFQDEPLKCATCPGKQMKVCDRCSLIKYVKSKKLPKN